MQVLPPFLSQVTPDLNANYHFAKAPIRFGKIVDHRISILHWHCHPQIWYTVRGSYYHTIRGERILQTPGSLAIIAPYSPHQIDSSETKLEDTEVYSVIFPNDVYDQNLLPFFSLSYSSVSFENFLLSPFIHLQGKDKEYADELFRSIISSIAPNNQEARVSKIFCKLNNFFELCIKQIPKSEIKKSSVFSSYERAKFINDSVNFSLDNFRSPITIEDARNYAIMSRRSFTEKFKTTVGQTYTEFIMSLRIRKAISSLCNTNMTVYEIADYCGFSNSGHLISVCTDYCGMTPLHIRAKSEEYGNLYADMRNNHRSHMIELNPWLFL